MQCHLCSTHTFGGYKKAFMIDIEVNLNNENRGAFNAIEDGEKIGEMDIAVKGQDLIVYHTEVDDKAEGKGYAKQMLDAMVKYAREKHLSVVPYCPYVKVQFERHPEDYADIWKKEA